VLWRGGETGGVVLCESIGSSTTIECAGSSTTTVSVRGSASGIIDISVASSTIDSDVVNDGSTSRGIIDESRPENERLG
jgi:hypothetical protein